MARYFGAHVDDAGIALESSDGLLLLGMIIMSLSIISTVIFACGDDNSGTPGKWRCRRKRYSNPHPSPSPAPELKDGQEQKKDVSDRSSAPVPDEVGVSNLSSAPGPDEVGGGRGRGRGRGRLGLGLRGRETGLGSGMCDAYVSDDDDGTGI